MRFFNSAYLSASKALDIPCDSIRYRRCHPDRPQAADAARATEDRSDAWQEDAGPCPRVSAGAEKKKAGKDDLPAFFSMMARPERFELPTAWFVARYSIQLSYGRVCKKRNFA